jgi:hypothetical protein
VPSVSSFWRLRRRKFSAARSMFRSRAATHPIAGPRSRRKDGLPMQCKVAVGRAACPQLRELVVLDHRSSVARPSPCSLADLRWCQSLPWKDHHPQILHGMDSPDREAEVDRSDGHGCPGCFATRRQARCKWPPRMVTTHYRQRPRCLPAMLGHSPGYMIGKARRAVQPCAVAAPCILMTYRNAPAVAH